MNGKISRVLSRGLPVFLGLFSFPAGAQITPNPTPVPATGLVANGAPQSSSLNPQAVSQTGLLPVFAVDMEFDPSWVDGADVPSRSSQYSHAGVNNTFQQAWEALKSAGFNMLRFPLDVDDPQSPKRLANLCLWAKQNNVSLIPILKTSFAHQKNQATSSNALSGFVSTLVSLLHQPDPLQFAAYSQIAFYQIEGTTNHQGRYPGISSEAAQQMLLSGADALRKSETQALQGTGVQATPILIAVSFDYELIRQGAINGVPLDAATEQKAQAALKQFVEPCAAAQNMDAVNVEWFPRSISSGDVDHFPTLLRFLQSVLPAKQLILTTGISTAFNSSDQQAQFYALTVSNLGDLRASNGINSSFVGVVFRQAFQGAAADASVPAGTDMSKWDWSEKARQLSAMWSQGTKSDELAWWLGKVQDNMGVISIQKASSGEASITKLPALAAFQQISTTVAQASQNVTSPATVTAATSFTPAGPPVPSFQAAATTPYLAGVQAAPQNSGSTFQQMMLAILQQFTTQMTNSLVTKLSGSSNKAAQFNAYPSTNLSPNQPAQNTPYPSAGNQAGTPNYGPSATGSQTGFTSNGGLPSGIPASMTTNASANTVSLSSQDITVDKPKAILGQPVQITAQIHNLASDRDLTGLSVSLMDPAGLLVNLPTQSGVAVPRSGSTPVQITWTPSQPNTSAYQLLLQVVDRNGVQIATAPVPGITVSASDGSAMNAGMPSGNSPLNQGVAPTSAPQTSSTGSTGAPYVSTSAAQPAPVQPQVVFFGIANGGQQIGAGQLPTLLLQIANPSDVPTQPIQASLSLDGLPGPNQVLGSLLPRQTRSALFPGFPATPGVHSVQVVVTTGDGGTASANTSVNVLAQTVPFPVNTSGVIPNSSGGPTTVPPNAMRVRSGTATTFRIGAVSQTTTPSQPANVQPQFQTPANSVAPAASSSPSSQAALPSGGTAAAPSSTVNANPANNTASAGTTTAAPKGLPQTSVVSGGTTIPNRNLNSSSASTSPATVRGVRTITPTTPSAIQRANALSRPSPPAAATAPAISSSPQPSVTTITPAAVAAAPQPTQQTNVTGKPIQPGSGTTPATSASSKPTVRTITPGALNAGSQAGYPAAGSVSGSGGVSTIVGRPASAVRPGTTVPNTQGNIDLSISLSDIHFVPAPPKPGQTTTFSVVVRNLGTGTAQGAQVVFRLLADGRQAAASQPMAFNISARGTFQANWTTLLPPGRQMQVIASVSASGDVNPANNQAALTFNVSGANSAPRR